MVYFKAEPMKTGELYQVIEYEGKKWFVPYWLDRRDIGKSKPLRIICLDGFFRYSKVPSAMGSDYLLLELISRDIPGSPSVQGTTAQPGVIELPPLEFPNPTLLQ